MAFLPPLLLLLFAVWAGTFYGGASAAGALAGELAVLGLVSAGALAGWLRFDALRLGRLGRWLPPAVLVAVAASWWASPVPRAGRVAVLLLPAFLLLPSVVETCWRGRERRRAGLRAVAGVVLGVAGWALADHLLLGSPRASAPLGHHGLLAVWLLATLPLAVLPAREKGPWRRLGWAAGAVGIAALAATRSLAGWVGLAGLVVGAALFRRPERRRRRGAGVALPLLIVVVLAVLAAPRLAALLRGKDASFQARAVYAEGAWHGWKERPWLGWGPGSTPWTVSRFLRPRPGINPPGEVVGQLHSLPLQWAYELGFTGLLLALGTAGAFAGRRLRPRRERAEGRDRALLAASLGGLGAGAVGLLGTAELAVTALPVALAVAAGGALAATGEEPGPRWQSTPRAGFPARGAVGWLALAYAATALVALLPLARAQLHYERSLRLTGTAAARELAVALAEDPHFPLYRAWTTWVGGTSALGRRAAAEPALEAARDAVGVGPLWLMAGVYGLEARSSWAAEALERACRLDPLAPLAPFYRLVLEPGASAAPLWGARALLAEPRLLAARFWEERPELLAASLAAVERWPGVEAGWKVELLATAERLGNRAPAGAAEPRGEAAPPEELLWSFDETGVDSLSLHLFRRLPRVVRLAPVAMRRGLAAAVSMPPASALPGTSRAAFSGGSCGVSGASELSTKAVENSVEMRAGSGANERTTGVCAL